MPGPFDKSDKQCDECDEEAKPGFALPGSNSKFCSEEHLALHRCDKVVNNRLCDLARDHEGGCKGWSRMPAMGNG